METTFFIIYLFIIYFFNKYFAYQALLETWYYCIPGIIRDVVLLHTVLIISEIGNFDSSLGLSRLLE